MVVDPFSQMEPEHLARLESALQSEQAKEILGTNLGDNLTEMLGKYILILEYMLIYYISSVIKLNII